MAACNKGKERFGFWNPEIRKLVDKTVDFINEHGGIEQFGFLNPEDKSNSYYVAKLKEYETPSNGGKENARETKNGNAAETNSRDNQRRINLRRPTTPVMDHVSYNRNGRVKGGATPQAIRKCRPCTPRGNTPVLDGPKSPLRLTGGGPVNLSVDLALQSLTDVNIPYVSRESLSLQTGMVLGQGTFGIVYKGSLKGKPVAIKMLRNKDISAELLQEFQQEVRMAAHISRFGPRVVKPLAVATDRHGSLLLVSEYVPGGDLSAYINCSTWWTPLKGKDSPVGKYTDKDDCGRQYVYALPRPLLRHYSREIVLSLCQLKEAGVVHRDLKPQNFLLTKEDVKGQRNTYVANKDEERLVCCDFGMAFLVTDQANHGDFTAGTRGYIAPEIDGSGGTVGHAVDVFSVGVILIELWCGAVWQPGGSEEPEPLNGKDFTPNEWYQWYRQTEVREALKKIRKIEPAAAWLFGRCVSPKAKQRPEAEELRKALDDIFIHEEDGGGGQKEGGAISRIRELEERFSNVKLDTTDDIEYRWAPDGCAYTREEFQSYYGGDEDWGNGDDEWENAEIAPMYKGGAARKIVVG